MTNNDLMKVKRAFAKVSAEVGRQEIQLIKFAATDYLFSLKANITSEKYANATWKYSLSYQDFKNKEHPGKPFWKFSDDLFNAIANSAETNGRFVGIPTTATNSEGEKIGPIAIQTEYGKNRQPARAVFGPTFDDYFDNKFQKRADTSLLRILGKWM